MQKAALKKDPEAIRRWQKRSRERYFEKQKKIAEQLKRTVKKPRAKLRQQSKRRGQQMREYYAIRKEWLARPEHQKCAICLLLDQPPRRATEVHHVRGRQGRLLCDTRFWVANCHPCRLIPHKRPAWAREVGILSTAAEWNTYPAEK